MIIFKRIRWRNLLSTGNAFTEIDFVSHKSTLIVGDNGAGKSTILDALSFVLYGKPFRKVNKPQLINSINQKGMLVEIEFDIGNKHYQVNRGQKPTVFEILQNGQLINQSAESKDYQEMLEKSILKMNHKSFSQIVVLGSASFVPFMQLGAPHRREIIEDLLDIQVFSKMNSLLKDRVQSNKEEITLLDQTMKGVAEKIELEKKHIAALERNSKAQIEQKQNKIQEYKEDSEEITRQIQEIVGRQKELQVTVDDTSAVKKMEECDELRRSLKTKASQLSKELTFFEAHDDCPTCKQGIVDNHKQHIIETNKEQLTTVSAAIEKLVKKTAKLQAQVDVIEKAAGEISKLHTEIAILNTKKKANDKYIVEVQKEIEALEKESVDVTNNSDEIKALRGELKELLHQREELTEQKKVLDVASTLLKDTGIKTKIIKQYVPVINKLINKYLASMDFFVNFELNENFEEKIKSRFRDEFSYASFSEGEKSRLDLALLFTWRAVAKLRNSASTNLLILDEVFDGSLDTTGNDELLKILQTLVNGNNVFVISHKTDAFLDKFERVLRFAKHKNFSRIVEA